MKRTYIKPFMESEQFVTNEFAAACWLVTCETNGENFITHVEPVPDYEDEEVNDGYTWGLGYDGFGDYYNNKNGEFTHPSHAIFQDWAAHKIDYKEVSQAGVLSNGKKYGPNAS